MDKASSPQPANPFSFIELTWNMLLPIVAFIMGTVGSFWVSPPYTPGSDNAAALTHFAKFIVAVIIGLMVLILIKKGAKKHASFWGKVAAVALIASVAAFFVYQGQFSKWAVIYKIDDNNKKVLIIGSVVKEDVKEFVEKNKDMTKRELLHHAAWKPSNIWTAESIRHHRRILSAMYVLFTPLFAITMVAVAQVINCAMKRK